MGNKRILKGNKTTVDKNDNYIPYYLTNAITQSTDTKGDTDVPVVDMDNVKDAKRFVDENHK